MADLTIPADIIEGFLEILEEVGVEGQLQINTVSGTEFNPIITPSTENIDLVPVNYKVKEIDGTVIQQGDRKFLFLSTAIPTTTGKVILDSINYNIVDVQIVAVSGVTVLYKVQGRK